MNTDAANPTPSTNALNRRRWVIFLTQQSIVFIVGWAYLKLVRMLTGKTIHNGRDPFGIIDGVAFVLLFIAVIVFTWWLYHKAEGKGAPSLGIALSFRRLRDLLAGTLIGFVSQGWVWIASLILGTVAAADKVGVHFGQVGIIRVISIGTFFLLLNSVLEEVTDRAFPMRLWAHRSLAFRVVVPSIFFAALHLADERFSALLFYERFVAGVVLSCAYSFTGNIWLAAGLHTGINYARFSVSGLWHVGAVVSLKGQLLVPLWAADIVWSVVAVGAYIWLSRRERTKTFALPSTPQSNDPSGAVESRDI